MRKRFWQQVKDFFTPSVWLRSRLRKWSERWKGTYYEGPQPPPRLREEVELFTAAYPMASEAEWMEFAIKLAQNSYRDGFVRGYEWQERGWGGPEIEPEQLAEMQAQDWSLRDAMPRYDKLLKTGRLLDDPLAGATRQQRQAFMEMLNDVGRSPYEATVDISPYYDEEEDEDE